MTAFIGGAPVAALAWGPCGGLVSGALVSAAIAWCHGATLQRWGRRHKWLGNRVLMSLLVFAVSAGACALIARPPSARALFEKHFGFEMPKSVQDARSCVRWTFADPAYFVRFTADQQTIDRITAQMTLDDPALKAHLRMGMSPEARRLPAWWRPHDVESPRVWTGRGYPHILVCVDSESGFVYIRIVYT